MYRRKRSVHFEDKLEGNGQRWNGDEDVATAAKLPKRRRSLRQPHFQSRYCFGLMLFQGAALFIVLSVKDSVVPSRNLRSASDASYSISARLATNDHSSGRLPGDSRYDILSEPLDNYYSRKHLGRFPEQYKKPILVVGGSDGSGTRAVVDLLGQLGVPMLVDDTGTYDVDAHCLYEGQGWPPLVQKVLESTHSASYELTDLPDHLLHEVKPELEHCRDIYRNRADKLLLDIELTNRTLTSKVNYGFKAPVSFLLLPLLREVYGPIKFLHVVRDGRDIAMSDNQSPVQKFYNSFYVDSEDRRRSLGKWGNDERTFVMAMQLWNEWNSQVHDWCERQNDGETFDYLAMRSEDLVDPQQRLESIIKLAHFVGSPKTDEAVCCISNKGLTDMGRSNGLSGRTGTDARAIVPFANLDTLSDHGSTSGLYESNLEARYESWLDSAKMHKTDSLVDSSNDSGKNDPKEIALKKSQEELAKLLHSKAKRNEPLSRTNFRNDRSPQAAANVEMTNNVTDASIDEANHASKPRDITMRYGKWVRRLMDAPDLADLLHSQGSATLRLFGYHPVAQFQDKSSSTSFHCDSSERCDEF